MICAIHQPQYLPWLGYFDKLDTADLFVFLDDTQFKKNEWQNRNKIRSINGAQWLTVPVLHQFGQEIRDVRIDSRSNWCNKHYQALVTNYSKAPHFREHRPFLQETFERDWDLLVDISVHFVQYLGQQLGIETEIIQSSSLGIDATATEALVAICKAVGADTYLSGIGGRDYLEQQRFRDEGIALVYQEFQHPSYPQLHGEFLSHLSVVDLVFNCGVESLEIIRKSRATGSESSSPAMGKEA